MFKSIVWDSRLQMDDLLLELFFLLTATGMMLYGGGLLIFSVWRQLILPWIDCVTLDWEQGVIRYRHREIGRIDQIRCIYLRTIHKPGPPIFLSSILMQDGRQIWLEELDDFDEITVSINQIAQLANTPLKLLD